MSLIPAFKLGVWNAWIITAIYNIIPSIPSLTNKDVVKKRLGEAKWSELSKTDKIVAIITHAIIGPFTIIYSFFLPLKLGTVWFYEGLPISIMGILMCFMVDVSFAYAPHNKRGLQHFKTPRVFLRVFSKPRYRHK